MQRRDFVKMIACGAGASMMPGCLPGAGSGSGPTGKRVLVVAFDGMDPRIVESLMNAGKLPNYKRLAEQGGFQKIATSTPPHTPVAFSNIISGSDPALHNIFDFIHRDPRPDGDGIAIRSRMSTSEAIPPEHDWALSIGEWDIPLSGGTTRSLRQGPAFWDYLSESGIDTDIYYLPSNYPTAAPSGPGRFRAISGMGTPDLLGTWGTFTYYGPKRGGDVSGGRFVHLNMGNKHRLNTELKGPPNFLRKTESGKKPPLLSTTIGITRDPNTPIVKISLSGSVVLLGEGEWSDWIPVEFPTGIDYSTALDVAGAPTSMRGMVRLYVKQVHPEFELYVSPINLDPTSPVNPISTPADFSDQLAKTHGRFYTAGIPEDNKALRSGALSEDEFLAQSALATEERTAQFRQALADFKSGCLFFYFGGTDLLQHMFWRDRDEQHPGRQPEELGRYENVVTDTYIETDRLVGESLDALGPDDTLIVFSDHGFTSFRRGFNLNRWLADSGFLKLPSRGSSARRAKDTLSSVDWAATKAYGFGMNALYLNLQGREKYGALESQAARGTLEQIREELMKVRDVDGTPIIDHIDLVEDIYPGADRDIAPDMIIGYNDGYRASWATILGESPRDLVEDNMDRWSGTHLIAAEQVPGMLFTSRPVSAEKASVSDLAPTILDLFDIDTPQQMTGKSLFGPPS